MLQQQGLLAQVGERRRGAFTERLLQTTARSWAISPRALGAIGMAPEEVRDRFSSEYLAVASARTLRDVSLLREMADEQDKRLATLTLETEVRFASPSDQAAFAADLNRAISDLVARYHDESATEGRSFRFMIGGHPVAPGNSDGEDDNASEQAH